jgi:hypothetical protein
MFPVKFERDFHVQEDDTHHSLRRETSNLSMPRFCIILVLFAYLCFGLPCDLFIPGFSRNNNVHKIILSQFVLHAPSTLFSLV